MITDAWKSAICLPPDYGIFYNINNMLCCFFTLENRISPRMPLDAGHRKDFFRNICWAVSVVPRLCRSLNQTPRHPQAECRRKTAPRLGYTSLGRYRLSGVLSSSVG